MSVGQALYGEALEALPEAAAAQRATVHANAAAAHLKLAQWAEAAKAASAALEAVPGHEKALLRRAAAFEELADLERALADYEAVRPRFQAKFGCSWYCAQVMREEVLRRAAAYVELADLERALRTMRRCDPGCKPNLDVCVIVHNQCGRDCCSAPPHSGRWQT